MGTGVNSTGVVPLAELMLQSWDAGCELGDAGTGAQHVLVWIVAWWNELQERWSILTPSNATPGEA